MCAKYVPHLKGLNTLVGVQLDMEQENGRPHVSKNLWHRYGGGKKGQTHVYTQKWEENSRLHTHVARWSYEPQIIHLSWFFTLLDYVNGVEIVFSHVRII